MEKKLTRIGVIIALFLSGAIGCAAAYAGYVWVSGTGFLMAAMWWFALSILARLDAS